MPRPRLLPPLAALAASATLVVLAGCTTAATNAPSPAPRAAPAPTALSHAEDLRATQRYEEARLIYESWLAVNPQDPEPTFDLGYTLYLEACAETRPPAAQALRLRARALVLEARRLGSKMANLIPFDAEIAPDGSDARHYRAAPAAVALIRDGETAFSQGKFDAALKAYQAALATDPRAYPAALFTGDTYFAMKNYPQADEWFARAAAIDPNTETAYRYWGDSLARQGRFADARRRYLDAIVSEPYNRVPREMLTRFTGANRGSLNHPAIKPWPANVELVETGPKITVGPDADALTTAYALARAQWLTAERGKYFPPGAAARHSLPEEVHALRAAIAIAHELEEKDPASIAAWKDSVETLAMLDRAGLLEAYVLLDAADAGIAQDYDAYRLQHRELLLRYLREIWCREN